MVISELLAAVPGPARDPTASRLARARTRLPRNGGVRPAAHGRAGPLESVSCPTARLVRDLCQLPSRRCPDIKAVMTFIFLIQTVHGLELLTGTGGLRNHAVIVDCTIIHEKFQIEIIFDKYFS
jgi:hypothetical protein